MIYVSDDNFVIYAARYYDNPTCTTESEFHDDLSRIKFILKMFKKYERDDVINDRLILNHLILLYNVFDHEAMTRILCLRLRQYLHMLKPFLVMLGYWPERITNIGAPGFIIIGSDIPMDNRIVERLRKI